MIKLFLLTLFIPAILAGNIVKSGPAIPGEPVFIYAPVQDNDSIDIGRLLNISNFNLKIIPPSLGVQFYHNGIVFLSNTKAESKMVESHTSFGTTEAFFAPISDTTTGNHIIFSASDTWEVPCEAMTFSSDYTVMYYTKKSGNKESEKIYEAKYEIVKNGKHDWISNQKPLSFCNDKSVYTHPTLSADGKNIVFSSNRKESIGGLDLFLSKKEDNGWSSPENLGSLINTSGNELYPFLDQDNNLYFSSDGISGKGGYDIFFCRYNGIGWDKPLTLNGKINTQDDEIAFTIGRLDGKTAFYTSRSKKGSKSVQLKKVTFVDQYARNGIKDIPGTFRYLAFAVMPPETPKPSTAKQAVAGTEDKPVTPAVTKQGSGTSKPSSVPAAAAAGKTATKTSQGQKASTPEENKAPVQPAASNEQVVYRVQFASTSKPKGSFKITFGGKSYMTYEYLYNGSYRSCAGEFSTLTPAINLQNAIKKEGYPDAFVVAFRNNVRVTDPALFKR